MVRFSHLSQSGYPFDTNHLHGKQVIIFEGCFGQVERGSQEGGLPCQHVNASMLFLKKRRKACSYSVRGGGGSLAQTVHIQGMGLFKVGAYLRVLIQDR